MKEKCADCEMRKDMAEIKTKCRLLMLGEAVVSRLIEMCDGYKLDGSDYRKRKLQ